jgi:putative DNA methylase
MAHRRKLIEVAVPLDALHAGSRPETDNPFLDDHPRSLHNWWARTPLSVARALIFCQLIDDPGNDLPEEAAAIEREKLLEIVRKLATWEATTDEALLDRARALLAARDGDSLPEFWDMFSGRGSLPLEAQRLGLTVTASDLNPVAVLIERCLLDYPHRFTGRSALHPRSGRSGLQDDLLHYGRWVHRRAEEQLARLYPSIDVTVALAADRPELRPLLGGALAPLAWLWARTIRCPNPDCAARMPLIASWALSKRNAVFLDPEIDRRARTVAFSRFRRDPPSLPPTSTRRGARCLFCSTRLNKNQVRVQAITHGMGDMPIAAVCRGPKGRLYLPFPAEQVPTLTREEDPVLDQPISTDARWFSPPLYGLTRFSNLFTPRQLFALRLHAELIEQARRQALADAADKWPDGEDRRPLHEGGHGPTAYADALAVYLGCALSRLTDYSCSLATWNPTNENIGHLFQRQAIPLVADFAEVNLLAGKITFATACAWVSSALTALPKRATPARVLSANAAGPAPPFATKPVISTDPPYFDNIGYADLSDFFYVWLRLALRSILPDLFADELTPKSDELIASNARHGPDGSEGFFRTRFADFCRRLHATAHPEAPITLYYAFKESDSSGKVLAGWESMLDGLVGAGFQVTGALPVRTTKKARSVARGTNALASAIVLVCRRRPPDAPTGTLRDFLDDLRREMPKAVRDLRRAAVTPPDLAQAAIGPGMALFTRYQRVLTPGGATMSVGTALQLIKRALDEVSRAEDGGV